MEKALRNVKVLIIIVDPGCTDRWIDEAFDLFIHWRVLIWRSCLAEGYEMPSYYPSSRSDLPDEDSSRTSLTM